MKHFKTPILFLLIAAMCLSLLAGCGKKDTDTDPAETPSAEPTETDTENHPDYVYTAEYVPVQGDFSDGIYNYVYSNGKLLTTTYGKVGERELEEGEVLEYEGQNWIYGTRMFWVNLDGTTEELAGYQPMVETDLATSSETDNTSSYLQQLFLSPEGEIIAMEYVYHSWYDGPDDGIEMWSEEWWNAGYYDMYYHNEQDYYLRYLAEDGSEIKLVELADLQENAPDPNSFYLGQVVMGADGRFYVSSDQTLFILDTDGTLLKTVSFEEWIDSIVCLSDAVGISYWGEDGEVLSLIDPETFELGEPRKVNNVYNVVAAPADSGYDFCYTDGSNFMGFDLDTGMGTKILNWINCDVDSNNVGQVLYLPDGRLMTTMTEYNDDYSKCDVSLVFLSRVPYDSVEHKKTITLATQYLDWNIRSAIIEFNRSSSDYRIELLDYSEYNTEDDYSAGLTKLTTEILAGNMPDIIDLNGMPLDQFASKGLLADLYPLLDADAELSRDALFPGVLSALETDGKLYRTADSFYLSVVIGAASIVGDTPGWTLAQFKEALAKMPEGCTPMDNTCTRPDILQQMLYMELNNLIDWDTGTCRFDSQEFRDLLEFAAQFPEDFDWDNYEWSEEDDLPNRIATGRQMLTTTQISDFSDFQMYDAMFGGDATAVGYPVSVGTGNALVLNGSGFAISAKCAEPEAAWQFLRRFFTADFQDENGWGFPVNQEAFNNKLEKAMTPEYEKDGNGNYILDENGNKVEMSQGGWGWGTLSIDIYALTREQADEILDVINSTTRVLNYSRGESQDELINMIQTDTEAYFLGQKPLDEVVKLLQSKLNIYINEQR